MTVNEVYNLLGDFSNDIISDQTSWTKFELNFEIQPKMFGISGRLFFEDGKETSMRTRPTEEIKKSVNWLHTTTTENGTNKWNKAKFRLFPSNKFEMEFNWDTVWQAEVDKYNDEAELEDSAYKRPKWHWEK